jgi:hypothetical protein
MSGIKTILVLTSMNLQTTDKPLTLAMKITMLTPQTPSLLESHCPITLLLVRLASGDVFIINNDQTLHFLGTLASFNYLGTLAFH